MSYPSDASERAFGASVSPEPSIPPTSPLSRGSLGTYETSVESVPSADPASTSVPLSRIQPEEIEYHDTVPSADPEPASISVPLSRTQPLECHDIVPSADPGPPSMSEPLSRGCSQEIGKSCATVDIRTSIYPEEPASSIAVPVLSTTASSINDADSVPLAEDGPALAVAAASGISSSETPIHNA